MLWGQLTATGRQGVLLIEDGSFQGRGIMISRQEEGRWERKGSSLILPLLFISFAALHMSFHLVCEVGVISQECCEDPVSRHL